MKARAIAFQAPERIKAIFGANASLLDTFVFTADTQYQLVSVSEVHDVAGTDGSAVTMDVVKCASGTTVASGTSLLASTFNMKSTADTPVNKTISNGGLATAPVVINQGESIALNFAGALDGLAGVAVTITLQPLSCPNW